MRRSGRYEEIMIQRKIRGQHESVNTGPGVECFECGSFFEEGDNRSFMADLDENKAELLVCSTSFNRSTWSCISCESGHDLLPRRNEKEEWEGGRKLIIVTDQNMPPMLPSRDDMCPAVIRIDGGHLRELGTSLITLLGRYTLPEGSVIMIGSLSHLMEEGRVGYAKALVTEHIRFSKIFNKTVHIVPFIPPPIHGTNDPELLRAILDISSWIEKVQKWKLPEYYEELRLYVITHGKGEEQTGQFTTRHKLPKSFELYNDKVYMCHPWDGLMTSLDPMLAKSEMDLICSLILNIGEAFKWEMDPQPNLDRNFRNTPASKTRTGGDTVGLVLGGSNANRLAGAITDLGKKVDTINCGGWRVTKDSVDALLPILKARLALLDNAAPVIIWCMDSSCYRQLSASGDLSQIVRSPDGKYHVRGDLMVAPFSLVLDTLKELDRIIEACGTHPVLILEVVPRFLIRACCGDNSHCSNVRGAESASIDASKKVLEDLANLNNRMGDYLSSASVSMIRTGDLISGCVDCSLPALMDSLYEVWGADAVHGDKIAYSKIAIGLLDSFNRKPPGGDLRNNLNSRKRALSPDSRSEREDWRHDVRRTAYDRRDDGGHSSRRDNAAPRYPSNRDVRFRSPSFSYREPDRSAFSTYPGDQMPRRQGGPRGGNRRDY
jgi:hypothetical protein